MKIVLFLFLSVLSGASLFAQQTVTAAGGNAAGTGGTVSYTVGQVFYTTGTGINGSVAQGVQQPFEISVVTALEEAKEITLIWSVYPNPASDFLKLSLRNPEASGLIVDDLSYLLYDMYGKLLEKKRLEGNETSIQMGGFAPATYILKIIQIKGMTAQQGTKYQKELITFKIIKN